ncbi:MAG TPA: type VI secretion system protein TssA [Stellaceae bacterium]|jgi:type VI secretion system protein ImpA|nr:type VI secretion system protein TssA [Stellaceae bacterium]
MAIDTQALLEPNSDEAPSGASVEYDPRYIELEILARGVAQEEDSAGRIIREAQPPDWAEVERIALELCQETKDLRVAIYLARAALARDGLPGLRDALDLMSGYLTRHWSSVYPQLDPDDNNDPSARVNTVASLCDNDTMLRALRLTPLTQSRQFGRISYRDYAMATGAMPAATNGRDDEEKMPDSLRLDAAFADTDIAFISESQAAAAGALEALSTIDKTLDQELGPGNGPELTPLEKLLGDIKGLLDRELAKRGGGESLEEEGSEGPAMADGAAERGAGAGRGLAAGGAVRSRDDVLLLLDKICRYYSDYEPSSPVPLILNRTRRLVTMSFLDILKDLTPGGVQEFGLIAGIKEEEDRAEE